MAGGRSKRMRTLAALLSWALLIAAVPRRLVAPVALACALPASALAMTLATLALRDDPSLGHGIAIDSAGGT